MPKKDYKSWGDAIFWTYANMNMLMAFLDNKKASYDRTCYAVRAKAYKAYTTGQWNIHSLYEDNNWKASQGQNNCWYCGRPVSECGKLTAEHIFPRKKGGDDSFDNISYACKSCNSSKGTKDLIRWYKENFEAYPPLPLVCTYLKLVYKYSVEHHLLESPISEISALSLPFDFQSLEIILAMVKDFPAMNKSLAANV